jgi:hypothetical protein
MARPVADFTVVYPYSSSELSPQALHVVTRY